LTTFVVDAGVAVKWCIPPDGEDFATEAIQFLRSYVEGGIDLLVPDLFWAEVGHTLWKHARKGKLHRNAAGSALQAVQSLGINTVPSNSLLTHALDIAGTHDRSFYQSLYVALAVESSTQLVTADERLADALAARFPIKWLGTL
jgi:predicted nucleic acid-binding protein